MLFLRLSILPLTAALALASAATPAAAGVEEREAAAVTQDLPPQVETIEDGALGELSGGAAVAITEQTLSAVNSGNTINAGVVTNGAVSVDANAFSGFSGIGNFVINTGNNNNLQGSLSVNIVMTPGS